MISGHHAGAWRYDHGHTYFFALSGFLIGYTTFKRIELDKTFSLKNFLLNRALRTFPVYYLVLLICGISYLIFQLFGKQISINDYWTYFFFLQNYYAGDALFILKNLWAMAVTEQLYLGWGILMVLLGRQIITYLPWLAIGFTVLAFIVAQLVNNVYESTLSYAGIFYFSAYLASFYFTKNKLFRFIQSLSSNTILFLLILFISALISGFYIFPDVGYLLKEHLMTFLFCGLLMLVCFKRDGNFLILSNKRVRYLGKLSYGLYCYHAFAITSVFMYSDYKKWEINRFGLFIIALQLLFQLLVMSFMKNGSLN
jgi:peptidoglycan/LPS O-acetylase OafA/YrhL